MIFGGIQKSSLIDYPGKIGCVLFALGCNFACPYCHNPELALGCTDRNRTFDQDAACKFMEKRIGLLEGVVISGGEPTLQADLPEVCARIRQMGFPVKLDTNGSRPQVLRKLIDAHLVDYIAMDIKTDPRRYSPLIAENFDPGLLLESIWLVMDSKIDHEFKTTCIKPLVDVPAIEEIARLIDGAPRYALQQFRPCAVLRPEFFRQSDRRYSDAELAGLQSIAASRVSECLVR